MKTSAFPFVLPFAILALFGCDDASSSLPEPPVPTAKSLAAPQANAGPNSSAGDDAGGVAERNFNGAIFQTPTVWEEVPKKSDFVIAEFQVPGQDGPARLTLSTAGGDVAANIDRWRGQFQRGAEDPAPRESKLNVDGKEATLVELFGSFRDMLNQGGPQPASAMLGVVIPLRETNYFVKLTGPRTTITATRETFVKFVESATFRE